ncbi:hypothetical protein GH714_004915 [Hevea brasiliensis]|uniref:Leucine-rich repeat-containing N-terminal plant-type domain-containing protein n=1 Tax=Hevea brasiliensis TaxID=3981 RepID=A0A6A6M927_HEVBR|nr:hypothetical protein GH714_004915 [Hevea brasiliensis]
MSVVFTHCFLWIATISLGLCYGNFNSGCSPREREALLKFKHELIDPSNRLSSWGVKEDCCTWYGVICHNLTGHVLELHLRTLSFEEYCPSCGSEYFPYYKDYEEYHVKSTFGGKISPSLLNLKHLRGMVPHELGNLSNLHYLNLNAAGYYVENLHWLSGLSFLEFLDLSNVNLSQTFNWLKVINTLPSLVELHLSNCGLQHLHPLLNVNFSSLSILDFSSNNFRESFVPNWIFHLKTLASLNLAENQFQGPIPEDFQNMTSLQNLDLSINTFNSSLPKWFFHLGSLVSVNLALNSFESPISSEPQNITSLKNSIYMRTISIPQYPIGYTILGT